MMENKVCKECWADIDFGKEQKYTFKLSEHINLSPSQIDYEINDYLCSEYCLEQWTFSELEACKKEIDVS